MKINLKLRLQNKVTLSAIVGMLIAIIYTVLGMFGVVPSVAETAVENLAAMIIELLGLLGIVVDPSTAGFGDPSNVLIYTEPRKETISEEYKNTEYKGGEQ